MASPELPSGAAPPPLTVWVLNYGAGNVRSVCNRLKILGVDWRLVENAADLEKATNLIFPGVGAFGCAMEELERRGLVQPLRSFLATGAPYLGICIGRFHSKEGAAAAASAAQVKAAPPPTRAPIKVTPLHDVTEAVIIIISIALPIPKSSTSDVSWPS